MFSSLEAVESCRVDVGDSTPEARPRESFAIRSVVVDTGRGRTEAGYADTVDRFDEPVGSTPRGVREASSQPAV